MAARPLTEAVQQAEQAISGGDYQLAVETCRRVLGQFPEFATAHRILAEAYLEQGDSAAAERELQETLRRDPQSVAALAGLGRIAESQGDLQSAVAYVQAAWEIEPQRADLRVWLTRLSERLFGPGGRLHLTRAALASMHFQAGRWSRAAAESAAVLQEYPSRVDVQLRLAESLWRRGDDAGAAAACRAVLDAAPAAVMALLMLADIERRQGRHDAATALLDRARAIDPDGVRAADLVTVGGHDLADFLLPREMPVIEEVAQPTIEIERPRIAPAPDFTSAAKPTPPAAPPSPAPAPADPGGHQPFPLDLGLADDREIEAARPPATPAASGGLNEVVKGLDGVGIAPFSFEDQPTPPAEAAASLTDVEDLFSLSSDADLQAALPPDERPRGYTGLLSALDEQGLQPFSVDTPPVTGSRPAPAPAPAPAPEAAAPRQAQPPAPPTPPVAPVAPTPPTPPADQLTAQAEDARAELTAGWDTIDQEIQRAIPRGIPHGFTDELRMLDEQGLEPFFVEGAAPAWEPVEPSPPREAAAPPPAPVPAPTPATPPSVPSEPAVRSWLDELDLSAPEAPSPFVAPAEPAPPAEIEAIPDDLVTDWATVDQEIQQAIPSDLERGYTDELKLLGASGLEPFSLGTEAAAASDSTGAADLLGDVDLSDIVLDAGPEPSPSPFTGETSAGSSLGLSESDLLAFGSSTADDVPAASDFGVGLAPAEASMPVEPASPEPVDDLFDPNRTAIAPDTPAVAPAPESPAAALSATRPLEPAQPLAQAEERPVAASNLDSLRATITRLGVDAALFERSRQEKAELVRAGQIAGDRRLPGSEPVRTGPSLEELESLVQAEPDQPEHRLQLAAALTEADQPGAALEQYRHLFRGHRELGDALTAGVARIAGASSGDAEVNAGAHRLLGAIYRRAGNLALSASHYEHSLESYRRS